MKQLFNYFFRGLLFVLPTFATFYIIIVIVDWANGTLNSLLFSWLPFQIPGLGILSAFVLIVLLGLAVSWTISRPIFSYFERLISKLSLIHI